MFWLKLRRLFKTVGHEAILLFYACKSPMTPGWIKLAAIAMVAYVISPLDLVSDLLPLIGWADDFALLVFGLPWLLSKVPVGVRADAERASVAVRRRFGLDEARP